MEFVLGGLGAATAVIFTNPLEVIKIRLQLQGELKSRGKYYVHYRNIFHAGYTIMRHDGLRAIQKGLGPAIIYQLSLNSIRLGLYQNSINLGLTKNKAGHVSTLRSFIIAGACGACGASLASPFFQVYTIFVTFEYSLPLNITTALLRYN